MPPNFTDELETPPTVPPQHPDGTTRGRFTSEFWLTIAAMVIGTVLVLAGKEEIGGGILAASVTGYALSRGKAKSGQ